MQRILECFTMTVKNLVLLTLLSLSVGISLAETQLGKCCPPGEIFSDEPKVVCVPAPDRSLELYGIDYRAGARQDGFPMCNEPEDVSTTPLSELKTDNFLQVPACLDILHDRTSKESIPTVIHCRSNKDKDAEEKSSNVSLPNLLDVRRCCPKGTIFEPDTKNCIPLSQTAINANYSEIDEFMSLLPTNLPGVDFLKISRGLPSCKTAVFSYEISTEDISFENGTLQVMLPYVKENHGERNIMITGSNACLELTTKSKSSRKLIFRVCRSLEQCQKNACITKCCPEDEFFLFPKGCNKFTTSSATVEFYEALSNATNRNDLSDGDYGVFFGSPCKYGMFPLYSYEEWHLTPKGHMYVPDYDTYDQQHYCMDILYNYTSNNEELSAMICFDNSMKSSETTKTRYLINSILEVTSCVFLLLTLLVYVCLPVLQNLHGKTLMCHVSSLLLAFLCLATIPWITPNTFGREDDINENGAVCTVLGYVMLFAFLSAFCWLNVMCFDIWWTFGGLRGSSTRGRAHRKKFLLYSLYAWGTPLVVAMIAIIADDSDILSRSLKPNIGKSSCWFPELPNYYGELVFFTGPVTMQLISNIVFFILTAMHCNKVKSEIKRVIADPSDPRSKRFHADKTKLLMNVKLFIVMGITWITEIISFFMHKYAVGVEYQEQIFFATDVLNCLQGLLIFILFVLKKRVYVALKKRLGFVEKKKVGSQATTALQDPYRVKKSASSSTFTSTFTVSMSP